MDCLSRLGWERVYYGIGKFHVHFGGERPVITALLPDSGWSLCQHRHVIPHARQRGSNGMNGLLASPKTHQLLTFRALLTQVFCRTLAHPMRRNGL